MNGLVEHSSSSLFFEQKKKKKSPPIVSAQIENDMLGGLVEAQKKRVSLLMVAREPCPLSQFKTKCI